MSILDIPRHLFITFLGISFVLCYQVGILLTSYQGGRFDPLAALAEMDMTMSKMPPARQNDPETTITSQQSILLEREDEEEEEVDDKGEDKEKEEVEEEKNVQQCTHTTKSSAIFLKEFLMDDSSNTNSTTCTSLNSEAWLKGPRFGNARDPYMTPAAAAMIQESILDIPRILHKRRGTKQTTTSTEEKELGETKSLAQRMLGTSLCYDKSRFLNDSETSLDDKSIRLWAVRLIYLAVHYHQHRLAIPEARARYKDGDDVCSKELSATHTVGPFDYECGPNVKYLVVSLGGNGIGSNVRAGAVVGFVAGLAMDRVVVFVNNAKLKQRKDSLNTGWPLASCDRKDYQCFFQASTPCTITHTDLINRYQMTKKETGQLQRKGKLPPGHEKYKVIHLKLQFFPQQWIPVPVRKRLTNYAHALIDTLPCHDPRIPAMRAGADLIMSTANEEREGYPYSAAAQKIQHAMAFYFMRPHLQNLQQINEILQEMIPPGLNPDISVGLPIRASDKCKKESECLTFDEHMEVTNTYWSKLKKQQAVPSTTSTAIASDDAVSVIFTTESKAMVQEQIDFAANKTLQAKYPHSFRFVTNTKDVTPDTGFLQEVTRKGHTTADIAMLSSMTSFKFQLLPRLSIGNCCSNFHILLNDFLMEGCGAAVNNDFYCLQDPDVDPRLRVCCAWSHECHSKKRAYLQSLTRANNSTSP